MPTLYGNLSYTLCKLYSATLRIEISSAVDARVILRPPLGAALRSVSIDGAACTNFDRDSVTLDHTPAQVVLSTA